MESMKERQLLKDIHDISLSLKRIANALDTIVAAKKASEQESTKEESDE